MDDIGTVAQRVSDSVNQVIVGKRDAVELTVVALLSNGHILIEDVPGVGKTTLAKAMAQSLGLTFSRVQFTPDMLPSDVTGVTIYNQKSQEFEFRAGPVMSQILLADEVNRATPKTQSSLLEAMEERQITVDGVTHTLPSPFLVMATQNPIEYEGTFPLPEAQLDRFFLRVNLGYPDRSDEVEVLGAQQHTHPLTEVRQVADVDTILAAQAAVRGGLYRPTGARVHRRSRAGHPRPWRGLPWGQPARQPVSLPREPGAGGDARTGLRDSGRREGPGRGGAVPPGHRQPGRPNSQRRHPRRGARGAGYTASPGSQRRLTT